MLQLTSYERMLRYISSAAGSPLTDSKAQKQMIVNWIMAASKQIEKFLGRELKIAAYTEYFDVSEKQERYHGVKAYPITSLTDVYIDGESEFAGSETEIEDCFTSVNDDAVVLPSDPILTGYKILRARYTGGLAYNGVRSVFAVTNVAGTWTVGKFAYGGTSEAVGIVKAASSSAMTVEVLYGIFEAAETLWQSDTEAAVAASGSDYATLSSITQQSLVEQYPDIVRACEIQVRHYWKHKDDFELSSTQKDGTNQRANFDNKSPLTQEAQSLLLPYRRRIV